MSTGPKPSLFDLYYMKTAEQRPSNKRGPSGAWSRLKPPQIDPLELYGLPSKGETRLNDFKTQETFYSKILERYMKFCAASPSSDDLDAQFASLSLAPSTSITSTTIPPAPSTTKQPPPPTTDASASSTSKSPATELTTILAALRKLREAITATSRRDAFAQRTYVFNIHAALLTRDWESYAPALLTLLHTIHPQTPLSPSELHEFVGYLILDLACRRGEYGEAYAVKRRWRYSDRRVEMVLGALVRDDWVGFWRVRRAVDGYQRRVVEFAEGEVRLHALKCLGRAYLMAEKGFVERAAERRWEDLVRDGVGWELVDGERVVIRKPKGR